MNLPDDGSIPPIRSDLNIPPQISPSRQEPTYNFQPAPFQPAPYPPVVEEGRRNYGGWIALWILFGVSVLGVLSQTLTPSKESLKNHDDQQELVQRVLQDQSNEKAVAVDDNNLSTKLSKDDDEQSVTTHLSKLRDALPKLERQAKEGDPMAATLYAAILTIDHQSVPPKTIDALRLSKTPVDRIVYRIYTPPSLTKREARQLTTLLPKYPYVYTAAKVQALQRAGDKTALRRLVPPKSKVGQTIAGVVFFLCIAGCAAIWLTFFQKLSLGTVNPQGIPFGRISLLDADRLAIRAAQIFLVFTLVEYGVTFLPHPWFNFVIRTAITGLAVFLTIIGLQKVPVDGKRITLAMMGITRKNLGSDLVLGFQGFLAEFPIAIILASIGNSVFSFLPKATHPASEALARDHGLATVLPVLFLGSIVAPFWEELVFRGLLFPGLARTIGKVIPAIVLSSLLFASLHPQGVSMWLSLGSVGAMSCLLSYQSRSLVPSMAMHCLHNAAVFGLALLAG